jgi:hypothetical protein
MAYQNTGRLSPWACGNPRAWVIVELSPTIDLSGGFRVIINTKDHPPAHVHVVKGDCNLRVYLRSGRVERKWGRMTSTDERNAIALVNAKRSSILLNGLESILSHKRERE